MENKEKETKILNNNEMEQVAGGFVYDGVFEWLLLLHGTAFDADAHAAGGTGDDLHRGLDVVRVQVGHLRLGDLTELILGQRADDLQLRDASAALDAESLLDQKRRRRGLAYEGEGLIFVNGNLNRDDGASLVLRLGIECLAELHDVDTLGTECRTDRRSRVRCTSRDLKLDKPRYILLSHCVNLSTKFIELVRFIDKTLHARSPGPLRHIQCHCFPLLYPRHLIER